MPKREPTPPLDDDSKYFIINYPFPLHANMQIESERYDLAHWIASCIGQEYLTAIYHKPSAPNMVIIEVTKSCPRINALLGVHKWKNFLRNPGPEHVNNESRVYYCRYSTGREVQKHGWKRLDVWDSWFDNYDPVYGRFVTNPYPTATFCEVPPETQTDYGLCRPLPTDIFPRQKPSDFKPIVPGSGKYVEVKKSGGPVIVAPIPIKQSSKSWAAITASNGSRRPQVEVPRTLSRGSSMSSNCASSTIQVSAVNSSPVTPPPGLGPPSISANPSSEWEFNPSPITPSDSSEWPGVNTQVEIISDSLTAAAISYRESDDQTIRGDEEEETYWDEQPPRPADWDKPICPEHKVSCRAGICKVMAELERQRKKATEKAKQIEDDDGWEQAKTRGKGRGRGKSRGQARGRARGRARAW